MLCWAESTGALICWPPIKDAFANQSFDLQCIMINGRQTGGFRMGIYWERENDVRRGLLGIALETLR